MNQLRDQIAIAAMRELIQRDRYSTDNSYQLAEKAYNIADAMMSVRQPTQSPTVGYDPDHLNPAKGGNQASDDYWSER